MLGVIMSLLPNSLGGVALLVATGSAFLAWPLSHIRPAFLRWVGVVGLPLILSYCIHWLPVWRGASPSEYHAWELLEVGAPFVAGLITSIVVVLILGRCHANKDA